MSNTFTFLAPRPATTAGLAGGGRDAMAPCHKKRGAKIRKTLQIFALLGVYGNVGAQKMQIGIKSSGLGAGGSINRVVVDHRGGSSSSSLLKSGAPVIAPAVQSQSIQGAASASIRQGAGSSGSIRQRGASSGSIQGGSWSMPANASGNLTITSGGSPFTSHTTSSISMLLF